jgi:hypothetical protein
MRRHLSRLKQLEQRVPRAPEVSLVIVKDAGEVIDVSMTDGRTLRGGRGAGGSRAVPGRLPDAGRVRHRPGAGHQESGR